MNETLLRDWWVLALRGVIAIVFGVLALLLPAITLLSLVALFAAYAIFTGIVWTVGAIRNRKTDNHWWVLLMGGLIGIGAGVIAVIHPTITALVLVLLIGANALVSGVLDIVVAVRLRRKIKGEMLLVLSGLASILFGAIVFMYPLGAGAMALVWLIGFYAIATGILLLTLAFRVRAWTRTPAAREAAVGAPFD
jgi:uncharacterized membrane protein HdeD (DUF308 family)